MACTPRYLVEPIMFLFMISYILIIIYASGIYQADVWYKLTKNETLVRHCLYHKTEQICKDLSEKATNEVSMIHMYISIEISLVGIITNLVFGYLADRIARNKIMIVSIVSSLFTFCVLLYNSYVLSMPIFIYYIAFLIGLLGGGFGVFMGTAMAFISDQTDKDSRTTRIAIADSMLQLGAIFGTLLGGEMMSHWYWSSTPFLAVCINVFLVFYVIVVIRNPPTVTNARSESLKEILSQVVDVFSPKSKNATRIYVLSAAYLLHFTAFLAYAGFFFSYLLNPPFTWPADKIGILSTISSVANFCMVLCVPLLIKKLGLSETVIAAVACLFCVVGFGVVAVARSFGLIVVANILKGGSGVSLAIYRSRLSKLVKPNKFGQLFMVLGSFEQVATLISSVGLIQVYLHTRQWFTGFAFLLLALIEVVALVLTVLDGWLARRPGSEDIASLVDDDNMIQVNSSIDNVAS